MGAGGVSAAEAPLLPPASDHDPAVPAFEQVMGHPPGARVTGSAEAVRYLDALAAASPRVQVREYARSHEGRPLRYAIISHPSNMERIEAIRADAIRLSDPRRLAPGEAEAMARSSPVLVWLAYGVHGNEHSSTEAALVLAYHLAAARAEPVERLLRDVVVLLDPIQNPDGRERFVRHLAETSSGPPRTDPQAAEHDEPWPSGRFNHMLFDLNRDWFFQTQPETRGKVASFLEWMPQVYVDLHEMGSNATYYFAPPAEPINRNIPLQIRRWWELFGQGNASAFDRAGFDYYTAESFDGYYPGYGDSWPTLHGAVGMTYEQASAAGLAIERRDGSILTLRDALAHHLTASLATVQTAGANREALLRDHHAVRREAIEAGEHGPVKAWLIPPTVPSAAARLASLLARQGIEVQAAAEEFSSRAQGYDGLPAKPRRFPPGTFIVPAAQPAGRLVTALMEMDPMLGEEFIGEEMERRRLKEDSAFFDVTAWSLPLMTGVETYWTADPVRARAEAAAPDPAGPAGGIAPLAATGRPQPGAPGASTYAFLLPYDGNAAARAMAGLLREQVPVRAAGRPFKIGKVSFPAGSLVIRPRGGDGEMLAKVRAAAEAAGAIVHSVESGLTDEGIDLGSESIRQVKLPRLAVAYGEPVSPPSYGGVAHVLESVYGIPFTPVRTATLAAGGISRYDVVVLPDDRPPGYERHFSGPALEALDRWVKAGGTLITFGRASAFAARKGSGLTSARRLMKRAGEDERPADPNGSASREPESGEEDDGEPPDPVPGAILRVAIEPSKPPAFGYGKEGAVMVNSDLVFSLSRQGRNVVTFAPRERLRLAGFLHDESAELLAGAAYLIEEPRGRGRVILFADDPGFRGSFEALHRMFLNCVLFAPAFGAAD